MRSSYFDMFRPPLCPCPASSASLVCSPDAYCAVQFVPIFFLRFFESKMSTYTSNETVQNLMTENQKLKRMLAEQCAVSEKLLNVIQHLMSSSEKQSTCPLTAACVSDADGAPTLVPSPEPAPQPAALVSSPVSSPVSVAPLEKTQEKTQETIQESAPPSFAISSSALLIAVVPAAPVLARRVRFADNLVEVREFKMSREEKLDKYIQKKVVMKRQDKVFKEDLRDWEVSTWLHKCSKEVVAAKCEASWAADQSRAADIEDRSGFGYQGCHTNSARHRDGKRRRAQVEAKQLRTRKRERQLGHLSTWR